MEKEVKKAVSELLEKLPEGELEKAAGGLDQRTKEILVGSGILALGVGAGVGGTMLTQHLMNKKPEDKPENKPENKPKTKLPFAFKLEDGKDAFTPEILSAQAKDKSADEITAALAAGNIPFTYNAQNNRFVPKN